MSNVGSEIHNVNRGVEYVNQPALQGVEIQLDKANLPNVVDKLTAALTAARVAMEAYGQARADIATSVGAGEGAITSLHAGYTVLRGTVEGSSDQHAQAMVTSAATLVNEERLQVSRLAMLHEFATGATAILAQLADDADRLGVLSQTTATAAGEMTAHQQNVGAEAQLYIQNLQ